MITAGSASLHTRRSQLMGQFRISEKSQLYHLLVVDKSFPEKIFLVTLLTFV